MYIVVYSMYGREYRMGKNRNSRNVQLGPGKQTAKTGVWFGEIERKLAKLSKTTFTYRSSSYLFYGCQLSAVSGQSGGKIGLLRKKILILTLM
jgi:hypothetical protein